MSLDESSERSNTCETSSSRHGTWAYTYLSHRLAGRGTEDYRVLALRSGACRTPTVRSGERHTGCRDTGAAGDGFRRCPEGLGPRDDRDAQEGRRAGDVRGRRAPAP